MVNHNNRGTLAARLGLLSQVTCPHCWSQSAPARLLWVAKHGSLMGDPKLGPEEYRRFLPTRFNVAGEALDVKGYPTQIIACPECHLEIPRTMLEMAPLFLSTFGAPGSGKSYFLAAMTWELRRNLTLKFGVNFSDADPILNHKLNEHEETLFVNQQASEAVPMNQLILKTDAEEGKTHYNNVNFDSHSVTYLRPFLFTQRPLPEHPAYGKRLRSALKRTVCLYDNAGEDFQPGMDTPGRAVTRHLAKSSALMFLFDPTQDARWRNHCQITSKNREGQETMRQEAILQEAAARIRRYAGLRSDQKHKQPLIVIVTKFDSWSNFVADADLEEPLRQVKIPNADGQGYQTMSGLEVDKIEQQSQRIRKLLLNITPEIVTAAEGFCEEVIYIPVSAVGWRVTVRDSDQREIMRPADAIPFWVTIPYLYAMHRTCPGLIPVAKRKG